METDNFYSRLDALAATLEGDLKYDRITRTIYSTDASAYREEPTAVFWPRNASDIKKVISFARNEKRGITIRAAGTSLAGQVVTSGIIVDISRYMNKIIEVNKEEKWVVVEPGVVLDELNLYLKKYGLFFGPETSTSNRCNIGGMVGNNACGSHSIIYGSTRDHLKELRALLSDGSEAVFRDVTRDEFKNKCETAGLEGDLYRKAREILSVEANRAEIRNGFPDPAIPRRNTGYALDLLANTEIFEESSIRKFNFCNLVAGSEGTLAVATEIKLNLVKLPPANKALVCIHLEKRNDAFLANLVALKYKPCAVEMMDDRILKLTEDNLSQKRNRFFLEGEPASIVIVEFAKEDPQELEEVIKVMINDLKSAGYGYAFPIVRGKDISRVWDLRKAGLGVLANMKGDPKPVSLIEDTAINVSQMPDYIADFEKMLSKYGKEVVYHAHIGTGELHIRPVLNLKDPGDVELFRTIGLETALLVKKYRGSLSGEHGDGRLRGEFIPLILGEKNFNLLKEIKKTWDPDNILNPGKITDTPLMNSSLRYVPGWETPEIETIYDFSSSDGIIRAAEKCNGSGDCRKSMVIGGTMCPTFMATGDEQLCTRARANILREFLSVDKNNPWDHREIYDVLDLCIGCKGCKAECPSGVDIAKLKSEFLQHWYDRHGIPIRTLLIAYISTINRIGSIAPSIFNFFVSNKLFSSAFKTITGFASKRTIPLLYKVTLRNWIKNNLDTINPAEPKRTVYLFIDEFTNYNDTSTGIAAIKLLTSLGYKVMTTDHNESARTFISKGMVRKARRVIRKNIEKLSKVINENTPLIGIEPSAILGFRDEYPELAGPDLKKAADKIAANSWLIDEFITNEYRSGNIDRTVFAETKTDILLHGHCQQKAIISSASSIEALSIPAGFKVREIPSGCCGMAGSFGYEKEHFELSNKIGEMILFPEIRAAATETIVAAPGTSCRHHIKDGTGKKALHPVEILYGALKVKGKR
jgi:FAD/FMN-containing dehydrogenase/Fe-S oxidoreductase